MECKYRVEVVPWSSRPTSKGPAVVDAATGALVAGPWVGDAKVGVSLMEGLGWVALVTLDNGGVKTDHLFSLP
jgi:hypothetical protein